MSNFSKRKPSWWKTLIRAGIGASDEIPPEITNRIQLNRNSNLNNESTLTKSLRMSNDMIDSRSGLDEHQHLEKSNMNGTTSGKCVTLQQYKEQGAPKYAVVSRLV